MSIVLEHYKAGHTERLTGYPYFVPSAINQPWTWSDPKLNYLLERAAAKLGELNSYARLVPNISLFIQLHVTKEAVVSSRIEGTQTNIEEALLDEADIQPERREDWREVTNYIRALNFAIEQLARLPISSRLIRETHAKLLDGVRGENKTPGYYRTSQNWIGGSTLADAVFVPPVAQAVDGMMSDLEHFLHNDDLQMPALIRIGIAHYQFETIHPFLDGNGRVGRLLITLYLVSAGLLDRPLLYLSSYFEKNKNLYYDNLTRVRTHNEMSQWLRYFLVGVEQTATQACQTLGEVLELKKRSEQVILTHFGKRSRVGLVLLDHLFQRPTVHVDEVGSMCKLSKKAANDLVATMVAHNLLVETSGMRRYRTFVFQEYVGLFTA